MLSLSTTVLLTENLIILKLYFNKITENIIYYY